MLAALRSRDFALLWTAGLVSRLGDMVLMVALPFFVFDLTGSVPATGAMLVAETLPRVLLGSFAGVFVDRWDRRRTMILADLARAVVLLPLLAVGSADSVWVVYLVGFTQAIFATFFTPAKNALLPRLVPPERLVAANALNGQVDASVGLLGPLLGGALVTWLGLSAVVVADSASFALSAALIALIAQRGPEPEAAAVTASARTAGGVYREWLEGLRVIRAEPTLIALLVVLAAVVLADGIANVLWVPYMRENLRLGPLEFGWLVSANSVSRLVGLWAMGRWGEQLGPSVLIAAGALSAAAGLSVMATVSFFPAIVAAWFLFSAPIPGINVGCNTLLQRIVGDELLGRVFGTLNAAAGLVTLGGMVVSSWLGDAVPLTSLLAGAALIYGISGFLAVGLLAGGTSAALVRLRRAA